MTPSAANCAKWRDTVLLGCPVAAARVRTEGKQRPVRSANATRFCSVQCRCRRTVRYRSRVTGTNESKAASGVAAQPARKRPVRAHVACGANLALESAGDLGEARPATEEFPGSPGMQTRLFQAGFCLWVLGLAASRKWSRARSGFHAQRERGATRRCPQVCPLVI